mgnify:CR=1 FL=1
MNMNRKAAPLSLLYTTMDDNIKRFLISKLPADVYKNHLLPFFLLAVIVPQNVVREIMHPTKKIKHDPLGWVKSMLDAHQFSIAEDRKKVLKITAVSIIERLTRSQIDDLTFKLVYFATMKRLEDKCFVDKLPYDIEVYPPFGKRPLLIKISKSNIYKNQMDDFKMEVTADESFEDGLATAMTYAIKFVRNEFKYCHNIKCLGKNIFGLCGNSLKSGSLICKDCESKE